MSKSPVLMKVIERLNTTLASESLYRPALVAAVLLFAACIGSSSSEVASRQQAVTSCGTCSVAASCGSLGVAANGDSCTQQADCTTACKVVCGDNATEYGYGTCSGAGGSDLPPENYRIPKLAELR